MFDDDPRWGSDPRERDDDVRDRETLDPRDAFVDQLNLPRGHERELVHDRDRDYTLRGSESRTLSLVGVFRVIPARDLQDHNGQPCDPRKGDLRHLRERGLVRTIPLAGHRGGVVVLTERGKDLLESHRKERSGSRDREGRDGGKDDDPKVMWLASAEERRIHLSRQAGVSPDDAARRTASQSASRPVRSVRDRMPVGVDQEGRWVFLYLLTDQQREDFHWFLQQYSGLFAVLPAWVVQIVVLSQGNGLAELYEKDARYALQPVRAKITAHLLWYFKLHRAHTQQGVPLDEQEQDYYEARFAFGAPRFQVLHRRWMIEGDAALEGISSATIANALESGAGSIECHVLPFAYRHLSPLVGSARPTSQGAEDVDNSPTLFGPPVAASIVVTNMPANEAAQTSA